MNSALEFNNGFRSTTETEEKKLDSVIYSFLAVADNAGLDEDVQATFRHCLLFSSYCLLDHFLRTGVGFIDDLHYSQIQQYLEFVTTTCDQSSRDAHIRVMMTFIEYCLGMGWIDWISFGIGKGHQIMDPFCGTGKTSKMDTW